MIGLRIHNKRKPNQCKERTTFIISGSLQGPVLDRRHPPSAVHVHVPPRKSGSWLKEVEKSFILIYFFLTRWSCTWQLKTGKISRKWTNLGSIASSRLPKDLGSNTCNFQTCVVGQMLQKNGKEKTYISLNYDFYLYFCYSLWIKEFLSCRPKHLLEARTSINDEHAVQRL